LLVSWGQSKLDLRERETPHGADPCRAADSKGTPFWCNRGDVVSPQYSRSAFQIVGSAVRYEGRNIRRHLLRPLPVRAVARFLIDRQPRGR
jgi:hypothetical protein